MMTIVESRNNVNEVSKKIHVTRIIKKSCKNRKNLASWVDRNNFLRRCYGYESRHYRARDERKRGLRFLFRRHEMPLESFACRDVT